MERSVEISVENLIASRWKVSIGCKRGEPFWFTAACHVENVEMATDCDSQEGSQDCNSNDTEPEVISLATPSWYDNTSNECKMN